MKRTGFTMLELVIAIAILGIMATALTLNSSSFQQTAKQTAKHEAERLAAKIQSLMLKADRTHTHFQIKIYDNKMSIQWNKNSSTEKDKDFEANPGCSLSWNVSANILYYSYITNKFTQGATITVNGKGDPYYVIIATIGSRVRVSKTKPEP